MYRFNDNLIKNTFANLTKDYNLNQNYDDARIIKGFVTNATLSPNSSYHFHSLDKFNRGDILTLDDDAYMITGDIVNDRISKYKGIADYCNFNDEVYIKEEVIVDYDELGRPIIEEVERLDRIEYGVLRYKDISIDDNNQINTVIPIYTLFVRDTVDNRARYIVNGTVKIEGIEHTIYNIVHVKRGLIELRLQ